MKELNALNPHKGPLPMLRPDGVVTSGWVLLPTGVIGLRANFESADPAAILTTLMATLFHFLWCDGCKVCHGFPCFSHHPR